jgi:hypothetical protein
VILGLYDGATTGFGPYVFVYAHFKFNQSEANGQYLISFFRGFVALGRLFMIPISTKISEEK